MNRNSRSRLVSLATILALGTYFGVQYYHSSNVRNQSNNTQSKNFIESQTPDSHQSSRVKTQYTSNLAIQTTDRYDTQFQNQVLPVAERFFSKLEKLGMSPLEGNFTNHAISKVSFMPHEKGTNCNFVINGKWVMEYTSVSETKRTRQFDEITSFKLRKDLNPYNWTKDIEHIKKLQPENPIPMTLEDATSKLNEVFAAFSDPSKFNAPLVDIVRPYGYDLNCYQGIYRAVGSDPLNQLNPQIILGIQPQSNRIILNLYQDTGTYWKY